MVSTAMWFIKELELYRTVKPYRLDFEPEDENFPRTNLERVQVPGVAIRDIRQHLGELEFTKCGFAVMKMPLSLTTLDYDHQATVKQQFYPFVEEQVAVFLNKQTSHRPMVVALDHKIRKREANFPISHGKNYPDPQPVLVAHADWTPESIEKKLRAILGNEQSEHILTRHHQYLQYVTILCVMKTKYMHMTYTSSVWRPLFGPLRDFPLALCDYSTVNPEKDYELCDDVYADNGVDENYVIYYRPRHEWYYMSDQEATEMLLFRQYDTKIGVRSGTPHCAVENPVKCSSETVLPRQSIEVELIVYWDDETRE